MFGHNAAGGRKGRLYEMFAFSGVLSANADCTEIREHLPQHTRIKSN